MIQNPNDISAKYYDFANQPLKGDEITNAEIELIENITNKKAFILDVGCGSGRHLTKLFEKGYRVEGIDSSKGMLAALKKKNKKIKYHYSSVLYFKTDKKYNLIILMWNTFNEIALTKTSAVRHLKFLKSLLSPSGKILINSDNPKTFNPKTLKFKTSSIMRGKEFTQDWEVIKFFPKSRTTISEEKITVTQNKKVIDQTITNITQRWWSLAEIQTIAERSGLNLKRIRLRQNRELYLILIDKNK